MARDIINVQCPVIEKTQSVSNSTVTKSIITAENGVVIKEAFKNKNNSLFIFVENTNDSDGVLTFKAGNFYPNAMLGDLEVPVEASSTSVVQIQDASRFENKDGSINIDFSSDLTGQIYAVAKSVALNV